MVQKKKKKNKIGFYTKITYYKIKSIGEIGNSKGKKNLIRKTVEVNIGRATAFDVTVTSTSGKKMKVWIWIQINGP